MSSSDTNEPSKTSAQYHSMKGAVKETVCFSFSLRKLDLMIPLFQLGNVVGSTNLQQSGQQEHAQGEQEYDAARAQAYTGGVTEQLGGKKDQVVGAIISDTEQQNEGKSR